MSDAASYSVRDGIAVIVMNNPPVNGLGSVLRPGIVEGMNKAAADPAVKALVITGSAKAFSGGADIKDLGGLSADALSGAFDEPLSKGKVLAIAKLFIKA